MLVLAADLARLMLAGERVRSSPRSKVFSPICPPAAAAEQCFDREARRDGEGHRTLFAQLRDPHVLKYLANLSSSIRCS